VHFSPALSKIKLQPPDFEWVAQVSILRPGFLPRNRSYRNTQVSKSETWATHSIFVRADFIFLGGPAGPSGEKCPQRISRKYLVVESEGATTRA
jgi:hypothetical protein